MEVNHNAPVIVGDYPFADNVKNEVLSLLKTSVGVGPTNVKASFHTEWNWHPDNITFRNLKLYILEEIETRFRPGFDWGTTHEYRTRLSNENFWANVYEKGDYANSHDHKPNDWSFAYFLKSKWYDSPLVFTYSKKRIRPKEGRYIAFPSYLKHHVPKHRYNDTRITLSGNFQLKR